MFKTLIKKYIAFKRSKNVDAGQFSKDDMDTAELMVRRYPWPYAPVSVHKLLVYGAAAIYTLLLPISMYVQESRNKHNREYWLRHARETSQVNT